MALGMDASSLYIDGAFVDSSGPDRIDVFDPATATVIARVPDATDLDVDRAVAAARRACFAIERRSWLNSNP